MSFAPLPEVSRQHVLDWYGARGRRWLEELPGTVGRLVDAWGLRAAGMPFASGSTAYVRPFERVDGSAVVLKVDLLDEETRSEPTALRDYDGDGAVRLFEYDPDSGALLLEHARPGTALLHQEFAGASERSTAIERIAVACGLFRRLWREPRPAAGLPELPTAVDLLKGWSEVLETTADRAVGDVVGRGRRLCEVLAGPVEVGIANRDNHMSNVLAAEREPWLLIDPKPVLAERAFDGAFFLFKQQLHGPLGGAELLRTVADGLGADRERVRAWAALWTVMEVVRADTAGDRDTLLGVLCEIERA